MPNPARSGRRRSRTRTTRRTTRWRITVLGYIPHGASRARNHRTVVFAAQDKERPLGSLISKYLLEADHGARHPSSFHGVTRRTFPFAVCRSRTLGLMHNASRLSTATMTVGVPSCMDCGAPLYLGGVPQRRTIACALHTERIFGVEARVLSHGVFGRLHVRYRLSPRTVHPSAPENCCTQVRHFMTHVDSVEHPRAWLRARVHHSRSTTRTTRRALRDATRYGGTQYTIPKRMYLTPLREQ